MRSLARALACSAVAVVFAAVVLAGADAAGAEKKVIEHPKGYRDFTHVKSMVIQEGHPLFQAFGGIHHIYANPAAMTGYQTGRFPDGAVIVFDLLEAPSEKGAVSEGARKVLAVMVKDRAAFKETGGWGFEGFGGGRADNRVVGANAVTACFACHQDQKAKDYVFSAWRE
jgi:hypothetical protein